MIDQTSERVYHDDVIDLWAWHCICSGMATSGLARALPQDWTLYIAQATPAKYNYRYVGIACHNVSVCH